MDTLTDNQLETFLSKKYAVNAALDLIAALRDPIDKSDPMFVAAKRLQNVKQWRQTPAGLAGLERAEQTIVPLVQAYLQRQRRFSPDEFTGTIADGHEIPLFTEDGLLPPGKYHVTWRQFVERYAHTDRRYRQTQGLLAALLLLQEAGCLEVHIGGSFVTAKQNPGDIDYVHLPDGIDFSRLEPMLNRNCLAHRGLSRIHFGIDGGAGDLEYIRLHLQQRTVIDRSELCHGADLPAFRPLPYSRLVGSLVLDLRQPLPPAVDFVPSGMWDDWHDRMQFLTRF